MSSKGRVYRRCACRDPETKKQLGAACPALKTNTKHGTWTFAVDVPDLEQKRKTIRRGGFPTKKKAQAELDKVLDRTRVGVKNDDRQTVADYLTAWLAAKKLVLKPKTWFDYDRHVQLDIIPQLGVHKLEHLHHDHIQRFTNDLTANGRGAVTVRRVLATLSSALSDAVEQHRITHSPAQHVVKPEVDSAERTPWSAAEAAQFLAWAKDDRLGPLFEVIMGCGLRRGEALALRWSDIDLNVRALQVRRTVGEIGGKLVYTKPKTTASAAGVGMSLRVVEALKLQAARQAVERAEWDEAYEDTDLVFARENGGPLWPKAVAGRFRTLAKAAGVPVIRVHDLRHMAATLMIAAGVPLPIVSKMLRHSKVGITADLYGHLTQEVSVQAADAMGAALDAAAAESSAEQRTRDHFSRGATTSRSHSPENDSAGLPV